ncbi:HAD family hydrolase [uncultured Acinetobacter sp.]|uniref:HAD family hydrolase n=1 Tax=uncultured Acinetobacter sp. TaxID=165433 RepID=UPI0026252071|nr:HAD family hydrolase [uncultured Acinetobacter sp.]
MAIRAVLFDLDNTLTHRDLSIEAYSRYLHQAYAQSLAHDQMTAITAIIKHIDQGGYPQKQLLTHSSIAASVAYALQHQLLWTHTPHLDELTQFWFKHFGTCAVPMLGAQALLQQLKQQGFKLGVISNGKHQSRLNILQGLGFLDHFDVVHSSELVGVAKPNAEIFLHTAHALDLAAHECVFVGDHPVNDIHGAQQAGMRAVWLQGFHANIQPFKVAKIQHLAELWYHLEP